MMDVIKHLALFGLNVQKKKEETKLKATYIYTKKKKKKDHAKKSSDCVCISIGLTHTSKAALFELFTDGVGLSLS